MDTFSYNRPIYNNDFAVWMTKYDFNEAVTLSCPNDERYGTAGLPSTEYQGSLFANNVRTLVYRLQDRVYGRGRNHQQLYYAIYYECWNKSGWPTFWHAHCLFNIKERFLPRFRTQTARQWTRILGTSFRPDCIVFQRIDDISGATSYATKFAYSGAMFDMRLPNILAQEGR